MTDGVRKAIDLVQKLLRVAAPNSGATDHERASAAAEVVKLIVENKLDVVEQGGEAPRPDAATEQRRARAREAERRWQEYTRGGGMGEGATGKFYDVDEGPPVKRRRSRTEHPRRRSPPSAPSSDSNWQEVVMERLAYCANCGRAIFPGQEAWCDALLGFLHRDITCGGDRPR